jgi:hypothetical protein
MRDAKKMLIGAIVLRGFPVGYSRNEADGGYGIIANSPFSLRFMGYAEDMLTAKSLIELSLVDLAYLLEEGITPKDKDWKDLIEEFEE